MTTLAAAACSVRPQDLSWAAHVPAHRLAAVPPARTAIPKTGPGLRIEMGGGPRTYPGGVSKWQWKRMQARKAKQLLKARLARERHVYDMRKRAELRAAIADLERPWEQHAGLGGPVSAAGPTLFSVAADEQVKVLADRFRRPGGFDMWSARDGPQVLRPFDELPSARFFPAGAVHSLRPYSGADDVPTETIQSSGARRLGEPESVLAVDQSEEGFQSSLPPFERSRRREKCLPTPFERSSGPGEEKSRRERLLPESVLAVSPSEEVNQSSSSPLERSRGPGKERSRRERLLPESVLAVDQTEEGTESPFEQTRIRPGWERSRQRKALPEAAFAAVSDYESEKTIPLSSPLPLGRSSASRHRPRGENSRRKKLLQEALLSVDQSEEAIQSSLSSPFEQSRLRPGWERSSQREAPPEAALAAVSDDESEDTIQLWLSSGRHPGEENSRRKKLLPEAVPSPNQSEEAMQSFAGLRPSFRRSHVARRRPEEEKSRRSKLLPQAGLAVDQSQEEFKQPPRSPLSLPPSSPPPFRRSTGACRWPGEEKSRREKLLPGAAPAVDQSQEEFKRPPRSPRPFERRSGALRRPGGENNRRKKFYDGGGDDGGFGGDDFSWDV